MTEHHRRIEMHDLEFSLPRALPFLLQWANSAGYNVGGGGARYVDAWNRVDGIVVSATEANSFILSPNMGTIHSLACKVATTPGAGITFTITIRINGVDSALTFTLKAGDTQKVLFNLKVKVPEMAKISCKANASGTYNSGALLVAAYLE